MPIMVNVPIPLTPEELAEKRAEERRRNEAQMRDRTARENRAAGKPAPKPGMSLFVSTARGIKTRGRAGLLFSEQPSEVKVIDASDEDVLAKQRAGTYVVNPWGAERILADANGKHTGLVAFTSRGDADAAAKSLESAPTEALEAELARRRASRADAPERIKASSKSDNQKTDKA